MDESLANEEPQRGAGRVEGLRGVAGEQGDVYSCKTSRGVKTLVQASPDPHIPCSWPCCGCVSNDATPVGKGLSNQSGLIGEFRMSSRLSGGAAFYFGIAARATRRFWVFTRTASASSQRSPSVTASSNINAHNQAAFGP